MANYGKIGQRLISSLIDEYAANDPSRVWASMPVANEDLSRGFQDITYGRFANAIDTATWWLQGRLEKQVETVAYAGPKDLRYAILAVAALKLGKKALHPALACVVTLTMLDRFYFPLHSQHWPPRNIFWTRQELASIFMPAS